MFEGTMKDLKKYLKLIILYQIKQKDKTTIDLDITTKGITSIHLKGSTHLNSQDNKEEDLQEGI
jgi:hypothetical protein